MARLDNTANSSGHLVPARRVQGTAVYNAGLEKLGTVEDVMIHKATGRIAYAVLSFGGFLGVGNHYYPLPWEKLGYNAEMDGYILDVDRDVLQGAPSYTDLATVSWHDEAWCRGVHDYYGVFRIGDLSP